MAEGNLYYWVANWNLSRAQAALLLRGEVADMVDCIHANLPRVRTHYLALGYRRFGGYITGTKDIRWTPEDFAMFPSPETGVWSIDQSNLDLPLLSKAKKVVDDVEAGAKTIHQTVTVAKQRIPHGDDLVVYCSQSVLPEVENAMHSAGLPHGTIIAYQYRNAGDADLSVVSARHFPLGLPLRPKPKPVDPNGHAELTLTPAGRWSVKGIEPGSAIHTGDETWAAKVTTRNGAWDVVPLPPE